jgi:glutamine amidotransferase
MISIIDYGAGNLRSVSNAIAKMGYQAMVTSDPDVVLKAQAVILPGVGAAADTVYNLKNLGMVEVIHHLVSQNRPLLAICIGLQVLFEETEEGGRKECLGIIPGVVKKLPEGLKVPHMGWNQVEQKIKHSIFDDIPDNTNFYFVHSYYGIPDEEEIVAGTTEYGVTICSMLIKDNLIATQFHPERSGVYGLRIYDNFLKKALVKSS